MFTQHLRPEQLQYVHQLSKYREFEPFSLVGVKPLDGDLFLIVVKGLKLYRRVPAGVSLVNFIQSMLFHPLRVVKIQDLADKSELFVILPTKLIKN